MTKINLLSLTLSALILNAGLISAVEAAEELRVRCETRGTSRSKISMDAKNLNVGNYRGQVISGGNSSFSDLTASTGDEWSNDWDSNPADIAQGATAINALFIQNNKVSAVLFDNAGNPVISVANVSCRAR
jgi:hypothetical protein